MDRITKAIKLAIVFFFVFLVSVSHAGSAGTLNLTIEQGATFSYTITYSLYDSTNPPTYAGAAVDLTNYTARAQIRARIQDSTALIELTTENGGLTLGGAAGTIAISISATATAALTRSGVWDLELINAAGEVTRIIQGTITLSKEVTR